MTPAINILSGRPRDDGAGTGNGSYLSGAVF